MSQDARQQPRDRHDHQAQLLEKREGVELEPVLRDPSTDETVELQPGERDSLLCRRKPLELPGVGACEVDTLGDEVAFPAASSIVSRRSGNLAALLLLCLQAPAASASTDGVDVDEATRWPLARFPR
jgi:hypothetical protein